MSSPDQEDNKTWAERMREDIDKITGKAPKGKKAEPEAEPEARKSPHERVQERMREIEVEKERQRRGKT